MKFIKKHKLNEGYFGNVKDPNKSNNNTVAKIGVAALNDKAPEIKDILLKALFDTFGETADQPLNTPTKLDCPFIIPHISDPALYDGNDKVWYNPKTRHNYLKDLQYVPGEGYVAQLYIADSVSDFGERVLYLGAGIEIFVNKLNSVEKAVERVIKSPLTIRLVRLELRCHGGSLRIENEWARKELTFPSNFSCCIITKDINFEKLYELMGKFETLSGEVTLNKLFITGRNTISSLSDLPPMPFKTHEIIFTNLLFILPTAKITEDDCAPELTEIGNYKRLLSPKNYGGAWTDIVSHPKIAFDLTQYTAQHISDIIGDALDKDTIETYVKKQLSIGRKSTLFLNYNPYTNKIERT